MPNIAAAPKTQKEPRYVLYKDDFSIDAPTEYTHFSMDTKKALIYTTISITLNKDPWNIMTLNSDHIPVILDVSAFCLKILKLNQRLTCYHVDITLITANPNATA